MHRELFVPGKAFPQGSKKHVGNGRMVEQSKGLRAWRRTIHNAVAREVTIQQWEPIDAPVRLLLRFWYPRPKHHPKTRMTYPITQPDLSKLIRAVEDSMTTGGWWADDARVIDIVARERYAIPREFPGLQHFEGYGEEVGVHIVTEVLDEIPAHA